MPCPLNEQKKLGRPTSSVGYVLTLSLLWPGKCAWMEADGKMTYKEIKDAARWVEKREDPSMSDDPFVRENIASTPQDDGQWDQGRDNPDIIRVGHSTGVKHDPLVTVGWL